MSRYSSIKNEGCFCCKPHSKVTLDLQALNTQFNHCVSLASKSSEVSSSSLMPQPQPSSANIPSLTSLFQNADHANHGQAGVAASILVPESNSVQDDTPSDSMCVKNSVRDSSGYNFWDVQARQLGMKPDGSAQQRDNKVILSSSVPTEMSHQDNQFSNGVSIVHPETSGASTLEQMDLDSALNELGMLSTVTNSRQQHLSELQSKGLSKKRDFRLRSKSESSPDLASLSRPGGYRVLRLDPHYVTSVSHKQTLSANSPNFPFCDSPTPANPPPHLEYRDPEVLEMQVMFRRRSVPRMSRLRKNRYVRSRCPYKIPNRMCSSMQEADYGPNYFENSPEPFAVSVSSPTTVTNALENLPGNSGRTTQSKSSTASPAKPCTEHQLVRSFSVENLTSVQRKLELVLESQGQRGTEAEESLDQVASQLNHLHMS